MTQIKIAKNENEINLELGQANRHGLIAGATGTGKTITLKVLAEQFSKAGVPVFMSDVKGISQVLLRLALSMIRFKNVLI